MAQDDATTADPMHYQVVHEDDRVRVLRASYGPGEKSPQHAHPRLIAITLTDAHIRFAAPGGDVQEIRLKRGEVLPMPATVHAPENLSDQAFEVMLVELKD